MKTRILRLALFIPMLGILQLNAAVFYVALTGSDTAAGTVSAPFRTIQRGIDAAASGDIVLVGPGEYADTPATTMAAAGKSRLAITKNITVRSTAGAAQTIIRGQPHSSTLRFGSACVRCVYMSDGTLDGFTLADGFANAAAPGLDMTDPVKNGGGVYAPDNNRTPQAVNCIITGCGAYRGGGAHWATLNNCTVVSNYVNSTSGAGVFSCHVRNSIVMFNGPANDENYPYESNSIDASKFFYSCTSPQPDVNFYGIARDGGNNLITDPLFFPGTFRLSDASPCINAGNNVYTNGTLDAAGNARIQGSTVDIGAYERNRLLNTLTVINGSGSGTYANNSTVAIQAALPNAWNSFNNWTGMVATVADATATATTLTMPDYDLTIVATFRMLSLNEYLSAILGLPQPLESNNIDYENVSPAIPNVQLGPIGDEEAAFLSTVYTNAGTVIFSWSVDSEEFYDLFTFSIDGTNCLTASGAQSGVQTNFVAGDGPHTLRWSYTKDVSDAAGNDCAVIGPVTWIPDALAAELGTPGKTLYAPNGYDAILLDDAPPAGAIGNLAVRLGGHDSVDHNASVTVGTIFSGSGTLSFQWYASSEQSRDFLILTINGVETVRISGTKNGWQTFTTNLLHVMEHDVRWCYQKDGSYSSGFDCGWVDSVTWTQFTQTLTVENGSGSGTYAVGQTIPVTAALPAAGMEFAQWDGDIETIANRDAAATTLVMPQRAITIRALYRQQTLNVTVVNGRDGGAWPNAVHESTGEPEGSYPVGAEIRIIADAAPLWQTFDCWSASPGVVFANSNAPITTFTMPDTNVTVTAVYRQQILHEQIEDALTIAGQPLSVTDVSPNGVVVQAQGGIRYDDSVVVFGGPSVGAGQSAELTFTNFVGNGVLRFWWKGQAETGYDHVQVIVNGTNFAGHVSAKYGNWHHATNTITGAHSITLRFVRDSSYYVRKNTITIDRVTWIPQEMIDAFGCASAIPDINREGVPDGFEGEDGGVAWVTDAPGGSAAVRLGRFGYVNNNQTAQVVVTNHGTGILTWQWASSSEFAADRLKLWVTPNQEPAGWLPASISGKEETWHSVYHVVRSGSEDRTTAAKARRTFLFEYSKDSDVSVFQDCAWLRQGLWTPTFKLTLESAKIVAFTLPPAFAGMSAVIEEAAEYQVFPIGTSLTIAADPPPENQAFDSWEGDVYVLASAFTPGGTFVLPASDISLKATYVQIADPGGSNSNSSAASTITSLQIKPEPALRLQTTTEPTGPLLVLEFTGAPQTDHLLEWTPSLSESRVDWQPLTVLQRVVLGDTADGDRHIRVHARMPSESSQGFFRLTTVGP